jgi:hypothetical protein
MEKAIVELISDKVYTIVCWLLNFVSEYNMFEFYYILQTQLL